MTFLSSRRRKQRPAVGCSPTLPVIDGNRVIGVVSQGDVAQNVDDGQVGALVEAISAAP